MAANEMQPTGRLLVERDSSTGQCILLVKDANGAVGVSSTEVFALSEDFAAGTNTSGQIGTHGWVFNSGTMAAQASAANHIGITRQTSTGTSGTHSSLVMGAGSAQAIIPMGTSGGTWIIKPTQIDANTVIRCGLMNSLTATPTAGQYFERLGADTNWFAVTQHASSPTRVDSLIAATTDWIRFDIVRTASTSVVFSINGSVVATITDTITSTGCFVGFQIVPTENVSKSMDLDFCKFYMPLTR